MPSLKPARAAMATVLPDFSTQQHETGFDSDADGPDLRPLQGYVYESL
jgi:hypothetical protein